MPDAAADGWTTRNTPAWRLRRIVASLLLLVSVAIWFIPQDVVKLVAENDDVLLGRYSVDRATTLIILTPLLWCIAKGLGWPSRRKRSGKHLAFGIIALLIVLIPGLVLLDIALRKLYPSRYIAEEVTLLTAGPSEPKTETIFRRPMNESIEVVYEDVPQVARSYPNAPAGHPPVTCRLTTDARGFRNPSALDKADIVCLGDSFTEGSRVDDTQTWPQLLAKSTGLATYNLGVSGGGPRFYQATLEHYGLALEPSVVVCMIYAGNDFKAEEAEAGRDAGGGLFIRIKSSPIRSRLKEGMISLLGPINANASLPENEALSWMPLKVPQGDASIAPKFYAFPPKRLQRLIVDEAAFRKSKDWSAAAEVFGRIIETCKSRGIRIIIAYSPSAPAVVLPIEKDRIPASALRAFLAYRMKDLPPADELKAKVFASLDVQERMVGELCREKGAEFVSLTAALREAAVRGEQVYYTYDQHWTARGQAIAAEVIGKKVAELKPTP